MNTKVLQEQISTLLNENVLLEILQKYSGLKQIVLKNINIADSSLTKGYSYLSSVTKFTMEGTGRNDQDEEESISCAVITKILPNNIGRRKSFRSTDFFRNEVVFYNEVWTALQQFQESKKIKNKFDNLPLCLSAVADGINDYISLEDLNVRSYGHFKKQDALSYDNLIFIIRLLARFHALSFAYKDQYPKEFERLVNKIEETYFSEKYRNWYQDFQKSLIECSRDAVEKELPASYLKKFDELTKNNFFGKLVSMAANSKDKLSVITQGDTWIPNFLAKFDGDKLIDIKIIDFQLARCCSPVTDISFFLYSCASYTILNEKWDDIMNEYHSSFVKFISELGTNPDTFKLEDFQENIKKTAVFGIGMSMEALPFQLQDDSETADLDSIQGNEAVPISTVWNVHPIKNAEGRQRLANIYKHAIDREFI